MQMKMEKILLYYLKFLKQNGINFKREPCSSTFIPMYTYSIIASKLRLRNILKDYYIF